MLFNKKISLIFPFLWLNPETFQKASWCISAWIFPTLKSQPLLWLDDITIPAIPSHIQTTLQSSRGNICPIIPAFINSDNMSYLAATCSSAQCVDTQSRGTYEWYGPSFFLFHLFNTLTVSITSPAPLSSHTDYSPNCDLCSSSN